MITRGRALLAVLIAMLALAAPASAATEYVSLGDSYAAGPLIPLQVPPFGCLKSNNNYSNLAAAPARPLAHDRAAAAPRPRT